MVTKADLQHILLLRGVKDELLECIALRTEKRTYAPGAVVFEEGAEAKEFFMLQEGNVLLEVEIARDVIISLGAVKRGYSFGWSSLVPDATHTTFAVATEPSEVLVIKGRDFLDILEQDPATGYLVMTRIFHIFRRRLERRTNQFLKVMRKHPEIQRLIEL